jgi:hypothetical protein
MDIAEDSGKVYRIVEKYEEIQSAVGAEEKLYMELLYQK